MGMELYSRAFFGIINIVTAPVVARRDFCWLNMRRMQRQNLVTLR